MNKNETSMNKKLKDVEAHKDLLNHREYSLAMGRYKRGQLFALSPEKARDLFQFFLLGRTLKDISDLTSFNYDVIIGTAIEYDWFKMRDEMKSDKNIQNIAIDMTNNIFLLNSIIINREIAKVLSDPDYQPSELGKAFICTSVREYKELVQTTFMANEIKSMLTAQKGVNIVNNQLNSNSSDKTEEQEPEQLEASYIDAEELTEEDRIRILQEEKEKRRKQ